LAHIAPTLPAAANVATHLPGHARPHNAGHWRGSSITNDIRDYQIFWARLAGGEPARSSRTTFALYCHAMSGNVIRRLKPEEEELLRKREELAAIRTTLAERELELVDLRAQLATFEGRYLRQVGTLYAELDDYKKRSSK